MMKRKTMFMTLGVVCAFAFVGGAAVGCNDSPSGTEEPEKFTVTYARGATDATGDIPAVSSYSAGESFALLPSDTFARVDYDFKCWEYGGEEYDAQAQFTMPENNVTFTAVWEYTGGQDPLPPIPPVTDDTPTLAELGGDFYDADNWSYMTNDGGTSTDGGDKVYSLDDGSVKFHRANQSILLGDQSNRTMSFMLKGTNDWSIWFNSSSNDNADNYSYRLAYAYGGLRLVVSSAPDQAAAVIDGAEYAKGEWNRFDVVFETVGKETSVKVYINGKRAALAAGDNASPAIAVENNVLKHTRPAMFETGNYVCVKVWEAHNYVQLKPIAKEEEEDVPIIACIGASITEGAGAGNFYTESYPAQLQNAQGGGYNVINFGNSGKTVRPDLEESWLNQNQWTGVQAIKPDIAIINMGTNDSKTTNDPVCTHDTFKADYENLLSKLLAVNPNMRIYICTVPYAYSSIYDISNDNIRDIIAPVQREIAEEGGYTLIDLYEYSQGKSLLFGDGVHPNSTGYAMFVEIISKALEEGADGLTPEFRAYIDGKYNDPEFKLTDVRGALEAVGDAINLTVTGNIEMDDVSDMRLVVETGTAGEEREVAITPDANGAFTATMDLATLTSTKWYNVRVYLTETYYYFLRLTDTDLSAGQKFNTSSREVTVRSWTSGGEPTFSFTVGAYNQLTLTQATIAENDGKIDLTLAGSTNESALQLYVCDDRNNDNIIDITIENGRFEITFDLATLAYEDSGWYNVRLLFAGGTYYTVRYTDVKNAGGTTLNTDDVFYGADRKVTVKTWGNENPLSLAVSAHDSSYTVTATSVAMREGKLVFEGTTSGVTKLNAYLVNGETDLVGGQVTLESDGSFTYEIELDRLTANAGNWYYLKISADDKALEKVIFTGYNASEYYFYGTRHYKWEYWEGIAVNYTNYAYNLSDASITNDGGVATLTVTGTLADGGIAAADIALWLDDNSGNPIKLTNNRADAAGAFSFAYDISQLAAGKPYYIRLYNGTTKIADVNSRWVAAKLFDEIEIGTDHTYQLYKNTTDGTYNTLGVLHTNTAVALTADGIEFKDGYFVLKGTAANIDSLYVYLINTNVAGSAENYVEAVIAADGTYTAKLPLDTLLNYAKTATPFNLRYKINDTGAATVNIAPDGFDMTQVYWSGVNCFYLGNNNNCVAVYYRSDPYGLTKAEITSVDGKATLTMEGTLKADDTAADTVWLLLDENGSGTGAQKILVANTATATGTFKFTVDISSIEASTEASATNGAASRHYYIRLYKGNGLTVENYSSGTKIADVNSRWLADRLFDGITVVGDGSEYFFIRNTTNATYNTLGIIRVGKDAAIKLADIEDVALGYYAKDSVSIDLSDYVDANGTAVSYAVSANGSVVDASERNGILTVKAAALAGSTTVTVEVASDGERAFDLDFDVTLSDTVIAKTNNYDSFLSADSWLDIVNDGNDRPSYDSRTNSVLLQWGNVYQNIGATEHISFELWVNGGGDYGFEIWFRSTTNDNAVAGNKYVMNGYGDNITISREGGGTLASFPRFAAGTFTRFDITMFDVYEGDNLVRTIVNIYRDGVKVNLTGEGVVNGSIYDNSPIKPADGIYFGLKSWAPQIAVRVAEEFPNPDAVRIATVGDSITYGHAWHDQSYPSYLATELGGNYSVGNFGLNGASVTGYGGSGLKYAEQSEFDNSIAFDPNVIVIMLGANDANGWANAAASYESELRALIAAYRSACPDAEILLVTSAPTLDGNGFGIPNDVIKDSVNPIQRAVAGDLGLTLVDLREQMENADGGYAAFFRDDGVHLSEAGAQFVSDVIADAVRAL